MSRIPLLLVAVLAGAALSGCFGSDDAPDADSGDLPEAKATDATGALDGSLVTSNLEPVHSGVVSLGQGADALYQATSDERGRFVINGIEPGEYRLHVSAVCCQVAARDVTVAAGEVTTQNLQLEVLSSDDFRVPYSDPDEWSGMISCALVGVALCGIQGDIVEDLKDPNDRFMTEFDVNRGIKSLVVAIEWQATGGTAGRTMSLYVENTDCGGTGCSYRYALATGESPLEVRIDNDDITNDEFLWDAIEDNRTLQFRVFPGEPTDVMYQQAFTVYYEKFYWAEAPEGHTVLPDG